MQIFRSSLIGICLLVWGMTTLKAQILVGGTLSESQSWDLQDLPYIVTSDLIIPPGITLQVQAGVEIRFFSETSLKAEGSLLIEGTPEEPVFLAPASLDEFWAGLEFSGPQSMGQLHEAIFFRADTALAFDSLASGKYRLSQCAIIESALGLSYAHSIALALEGCAFIGNQVGIHFRAVPRSRSLRGNEFCENWPFALIWETPVDYTLAGNCCCDCSEAEWEAAVLDGNDLDSLGLLTPVPLGNQRCDINPTARYYLGGGDVTVVLDDYVFTDLDPLFDQPWIRLNPNPLTKASYLDLEKLKPPVQLQFFDLQGRLMKTDQTFENRYPLFREDWKPGLYLFRVSDAARQVLSGKVLVR